MATEKTVAFSDKYMDIGTIQAEFLGHVTFLFRSRGGRVVLTDPFFCGSFLWQGRREVHLQPPAVRPADVTICDVIFISHEHRDHFDPEAVEIIVGNTGAKVFAPPCVLEALADHGVRRQTFIEATDGRSFDLGDMKLTALGGYDNAFDAEGRMSKFSLMVECDPIRLWFSGDCHNMPPALAGQELDAIFSWTAPQSLEWMGRLSPPPARFIIMHGDRYEPGDFWCNRDSVEDAKVVGKHLPKTCIIIPTQIRTLSAPP